MTILFVSVVCIIYNTLCVLCSLILQGVIVKEMTVQKSLPISLVFILIILYQNTALFRYTTIFIREMLLPKPTIVNMISIRNASRIDFYISCEHTVSNAVCYSKHDDNGNGRNEDSASPDPMLDEPKDSEPTRTESEPPRTEDSEPPRTESEPPRTEEKETQTESFEEPQRSSRIETYDEYARFRDSSRPPDSHYPPAPGSRFNRCIGQMCESSLHLIVVQCALIIAYQWVF
ncbi:hypothetical protein O3G_MSEX005030 [Manduca sexta]|uniref:Uncharacterized protein n=1 Tax=Manduca sexta TaxID=7130 RepID=A0A922CIN6_MANSE|nr:hypothetical protein O3G_MSEX005030 [Manduca sexta]